jgi:hypothetical protein
MKRGRNKGKYFQLLTKNLGYPKLREHLGSIVTMMKLSSDWPSFYRTLDRIHPRRGEFHFDFLPTIAARACSDEAAN